jgi:hypothetical protein
MARTPRPDGFTGAPSSWAPLSIDGAGTDTGQMPLFDASAAPAPAPACVPARHARLRGRLQALLAHSAALAGVAPPEPRASSWPDSFFDVDEQP